MKKMVLMVGMMFMAFYLCACGSDRKEESVLKQIESEAASEEQESAKQESDKQTEEQATSEEELEQILQDIERDFDNTIKELSDNLEEVYASVGEAYQGYKDNSQEISDWYGQALEKSKLLFERTMEHSIQYFQAVAAAVGRDGTTATDELMDIFEKRVYEDAFEKLNDDIYEKAFEGLNSKYYEGILNEKPDEVDYGEWFEARTDCYSEWLDNRTELYSSWLDSRTELYSLWLEMNSEFWVNNFDVDSILENIEKNSEETESESETEEIEETFEESLAEKDLLGVNPDLKEFLDEYEAVMNEYVDFMEKYENSDNPAEMLSDYTKILNKYTDYLQALDKYEPDEMSEADAAYYLEVTTWVSKRLLEAAQ